MRKLRDGNGGRGEISGDSGLTKRDPEAEAETTESVFSVVFLGGGHGGGACSGGLFSEAKFFDS